MLLLLLLGCSSKLINDGSKGDIDDDDDDNGGSTDGDLCEKTAAEAAAVEGTHDGPSVVVRDADGNTNDDVDVRVVVGTTLMDGICFCLCVW